MAGLASAVLAGCGGDPDPVPTAEVSPGTTVSPPRYLALVREAVARGEDVSAMVTPAVAAVIAAHGLYGAKP